MESIQSPTCLWVVVQVKCIASISRICICIIMYIYIHIYIFICLSIRIYGYIHNYAYIYYNVLYNMLIVQ